MDKFIQSIDKEICEGLPHAQTRLHKALVAIQTYMGEFRKVAGDDFLSVWHYNDSRSDAHVLIMQRIVDSLTSNLYKTPPTRVVNEDRDQTEFLTKVYNFNRMDALWQASDRMCHVADEFAFQYVGTDDPKNPIKVHAWQPSNFLVCTDPQDPLEVIAVITKDDDGGKTRYRLYTHDDVITYITEEPLPDLVEPGLPRRVKVDKNPYRLPVRPGSKETRGIIPFSFCHMHIPTIQWYSGGPGSVLAEMNAHINYKLSDLNDCMRYTRPIATLENTDVAFVPPKWIRPGDWLNLPGKATDARGEKTDPRLNFTAPSLEFVDKELDYINQYIDLTLQTVGVPPNTLKMISTSNKSGAAIVAEHIPLLLYAKNRQKVFQYYEQDAAKKLFEVAAAHYRANGRPEMVLERALDDFNLVIKWGEVFPDLPGRDRDDSDKFLLENGLTSKIELLKRRYDWSDEEAEEYLEKIAKDQALENELKTKYGLFTDVGEDGTMPDDNQEMEPGDDGDNQVDRTPEDQVNSPGQF